VRLPPLRERREDIIPLAEHFARLHGQPGSPVVFERAALELLVEHPWPGNVRQLQNLVERVVLLGDGPTISRQALAEALTRESSPPPLAAEAASEPDETTLEAKRRDAEREAVTKALQRAGGNRSQAARVLGVSRRTLYNKLAEFGLA
jgi:two-component system response regulator AtoC